MCAHTWCPWWLLHQLRRASAWTKGWTFKLSITCKTRAQLPLRALMQMTFLFHFNRKSAFIQECALRPNHGNASLITHFCGVRRCVNAQPPLSSSKQTQQGEPFSVCTAVPLYTSVPMNTSILHPFPTWIAAAYQLHGRARGPVHVFMW